MLTLFKLKLYSTSCCHLCEQAHTLISELKLLEQLVCVDIDENEELLSIYGSRIPVLQRTDNFSELNWPFNINELIKFLEV